MSQIENSLSENDPKNAVAVQSEVAAFWNAEPCDSENSLLSPSTQQYYLEIEADRYAHQGHILDILNWLEWKGRNILEIGTGVGTDARQMIVRGANYHGINVDSGSCETTRRALEVFGYVGHVRHGLFIWCSASHSRRAEGGFTYPSRIKARRPFVVHGLQPFLDKLPN
jgi:hypothetical protein